jgi:hypothetical protein
MSMTVIFLPLVAMEVHVRLAVMVMPVNVPPFTVELEGQFPTKHNQQNSDSRFGDGFKFGWDVNPSDENNQSYEQQCERMPNPPPEANEAGCKERRSLRKHRRDRCKVVRILGVP